MAKPRCYPIEPVAKPRMTQRDKWQKRPCVMKYRWFADLCRAYKIEIPASKAHVLFKLPMPKSWTKQRKKIMEGQPHQQRPDVDNLLKSLLDALFKDDAHIWDIRVSKVWSIKGEIVIRDLAGD